MTYDKNSVVETAYQLAQHGYHTVPVIKGQKAAKDDGWQNLRLSAGQVKKKFIEEKHNVGVLTGTEVYPGLYLLAVDVDVDDENLIHNIKCAFDGDPPAKFGSKGITFFASMTAPAKKRALVQVDPKTKKRKQVVELMATGQQVVVPPSMHPDTGKPYVWVGKSLADVEPVDLPEFNDLTFFEIELAVKKPDSNVFLLNSMEWLGEGGGGSVHTSVVTAIASLIGHGWSEDAIWNRVDRATRRAVHAFGESYDWPTWEEDVRGMIRTGIEKGYDKPTAPKGKKKNPHRFCAEWFIQSYTGQNRIYYRDGRLSIYRRGCFYTVPPDMVRHHIASKYPEPEGVSFSGNDWSKIEGTIMDMAERFPDKPPHRRVCLDNGTFDMDTGELNEWSEADFLISRLEFGYDEEATAPEYEAFLDQTFDGNPDKQKCIDTFEEFVAMTLFECHDYQKFLVLKGPPGTGKSTLVKLARALHGEKAVSSVPVHKFGQERYQASMVGKLLNIVSEVQATDNATDDFIKAVVSGDDVEVRFLYKETYSVRLPTRLLIACNEMFRIRDTSGAVERRMIILQCPNVIPDEKQDKQLLTKLTAELPGVFNRMVKAWNRLRDRGLFDEPASSKADTAEFTLDNNHTKSWLIERTFEGMALSNPDVKIPKGEGTEASALYSDYSEWAKMNGFKQASSITFGMRLTQLRLPGHDFDVKVKWIGGRAVRMRQLHLLHTSNF